GEQPARLHLDVGLARGPGGRDQGGHRPADDDRRRACRRRGQLLHPSHGGGHQRAWPAHHVPPPPGPEKTRPGARGGPRRRRPPAGGRAGGAVAGGRRRRRARRSRLHRPGRADRAPGAGEAAPRAGTELTRPIRFMPRLLRAVLVTIAITAVVVAMRRLHLWDHFSIDRMRALVDSAGAFGPLVFIGIFIAGFFLPGPEILMVAFGGVLFGTVWGFVYSWIACILGTAAPFVLVRYSAQAWAQRALHNRFPRIRALDDRLERHGVATVILLRLLLFLGPPPRWSLGGSRVRTRDYVRGTGIGILPGIGLTVFLADRISDAGSSSELLTLEVIAPAAALAVLIAIGITVGRRMLRRSVARHAAAGGQADGRASPQARAVERGQQRTGRRAAAHSHPPPHP